jgi:hypothetical protein
VERRKYKNEGKIKVKKGKINAKEVKIKPKRVHEQ